MDLVGTITTINEVMAIIAKDKVSTQTGINVIIARGTNDIERRKLITTIKLRIIPSQNNLCKVSICCKDGIKRYALRSLRTILGHSNIFDQANAGVLVDIAILVKLIGNGDN